MGDVYLAHDLLLERQVAIKFVSNQKTDDPTLARRLLKEAKGVAAIEHPNICPVFDAGTDEAGRPFIVMQYLEGQTLSEKLAGGPLSIKKAFEMCAQIADALAAAHEVGIVHRDLKPANIVLTSAGQPKVLDFGIAKFLPSSQFVSERETQTGLTQPYTFVGTPAYMSPEQIQSGGIDGRSDLFALGAVLFESLTGRPAFQGMQAIEILGEVLHVDPPPPSTLRPGVAPAQDDVCRQLLAKNPAERFQLATEAAAALRRVAEDDSKSQAPKPVPTPWWRTRIARAAIGVTLIATAAVAGWRFYSSRSAIPDPPPEAEVWFQKGAEALRAGAFNSAAKALEQGISVFPSSPTAYARLAEARAELDDQAGAQEALNQLSQRFPNEGSLEEDDRLRVRAMRWLVGRELDKAVENYQRLVDRRPNDAGAWVDLGRAQEAAVQLATATASFERAVAIDKQFPAAYVHLGIVDYFTGKNDQSLAAYETAERLYVAGSNIEGETEVLIRKGLLLTNRGEYGKAQPILERAVQAAQTLESPSHLIRAQLALGDVIASQGRFTDAERLAQKATDKALDSDLDVVAANGLIDLAITLHYADRPSDAVAMLDKARRLAEKRGARRTVARASTELASVQQQSGNNAAAVATIQPALEFFRTNRYLNWQLNALNIAARAYRAQDDITKAHELSMEAVRIAEAMRNESQIADVRTTLASQAAAIGSLPEALTNRTQAEEIHRRQNDVAALPYDLTNRAEVLIQLGRFDDASKALDEVEEGVGKGLEAYAERKSRVGLLRTHLAIVNQRYADAEQTAAAVTFDPADVDSVAVLLPVMREYARARLRQKPVQADRAVIGSPALRRERQYWIAAIEDARGDAQRALAAATDGLQMLSRVGNDELQWRLAAVGCLSARSIHDAASEAAMKARAQEALGRIRASWGDYLAAYEARPDLVELRKRAGL
jgi:tetratricopeptide (TPR) repeat protein/predicted Ser/Thr protein kinase